MDTPQIKQGRKCRGRRHCFRIATVVLLLGLVGAVFHRAKPSHESSHWSPYGFGGLEAPKLEEECVATFKTLCPEAPVSPTDTSIAPQLEFFKCAYRVAEDVGHHQNVLSDDCRAQMQGALSDLGLAVEKPSVVSMLSRAQVAMFCHEDLPEYCSDVIPHHHDDDFDPFNPRFTYRVGKCLLDNKSELTHRCAEKISLFEDQINMGEEEFVRMADSYTWSWYSITSRDSDFLYALVSFALFSFAMYMVVLFIVARFVLRFLFAALCRRNERFIPVAPVAGGYVRLDGAENQNTATWVPIVTTSAGGQQQAKPANQEAFLQV